MSRPRVDWPALRAGLLVGLAYVVAALAGVWVGAIILTLILRESVGL